MEPHDKRLLETRSGTKYEVWKWTCPACKQERSTLYIDGEWCHGHGQTASSNKNGWYERCDECWKNEINSP